jgi:hypothetical protein
MRRVTDWSVGHPRVIEWIAHGPVCRHRAMGWVGGAPVAHPRVISVAEWPAGAVIHHIIVPIRMTYWPSATHHSII